MYLDVAVDLVHNTLNEVEGQCLHQQEFHAIQVQLCLLADGVQADCPFLGGQTANTHGLLRGVTDGLRDLHRLRMEREFAMVLTYLWLRV